MDKQVFLLYTGSESLRHVPRSCKEGLYDSSYFQFFLRNLHTNSTVAKLIYTLTSSEWGCLLPGTSHRIHLFSLGCSQGSSHLHAPAGYRHWAPRSTWWRLISSVLLCFIFPQIAGLGGGSLNLVSLFLFLLPLLFWAGCPGLQLRHVHVLVKLFWLYLALYSSYKFYVYQLP